MFVIAHVQNGHISTSSLKSDITSIFLHPDFPKDRNFGILWGFVGKVWEGMLQCYTSTDSYLLLGILVDLPMFIIIVFIDENR